MLSTGPHKHGTNAAAVQVPLHRIIPADLQDLTSFDQWWFSLGHKQDMRVVCRNSGGSGVRLQE